MNCLTYKATSSNQPRITAVKLESTEIPIAPQKESSKKNRQANTVNLPTLKDRNAHLSSNKVPTPLKESIDRVIKKDTVQNQVTRNPIVTPTHGVKNTNFIIEEAIEGFEFLYSNAKPKGNLRFGENRTIIFDKEEEVDRLVTQGIYVRTNGSNCQSSNLKPVLKNRLVNIDTSYFEQEEASYLEDDSEEAITENTPLINDSTDYIVIETRQTIERLFTLHDIPLDEVEDDLLGSLRRLAAGVVETFRKKERCYKYVGRQQSIEEIDELEYFNDNLRCEVSKLNNKLQEESIKWEVVDQTFAENDDLKAQISELTLATQRLAKELELSPKWEDVDGLLEEDKQLKEKIAELTSSNSKLSDSCDSMQILALKHTEELKEYKTDIEQLKNKISSIQKENAELSSLNEKLVSTNSAICGTIDKLREENVKVLKKMKSAKKKAYSHYFVENITLTAMHEDLAHKLDDVSIELDCVRKANKELLLANANLLFEKKELSSAGSQLSSTVNDLFERVKNITMECKDWQNKYLKSKDNYISAKSDMGFIEKLYDYEIKTLGGEKTALEKKLSELRLLSEQSTLKAALFSELYNSVCEDKETISKELDQSLIEIKILRSQLIDSEASVMHAQQWQAREEICLSSLNQIQDEKAKLLEKYSKLEIRFTQLQQENDELSSFKKDYRVFDEKYDWLESVALSLRQEKEHSDDQVRELKRQLRASYKTIESLENAKLQSQKKPQELQKQLHELQTKYSQLVGDFTTKETELQQALCRMQELATMLRGTMGQTTTSSPTEWEPWSAEKEEAPATSKRWQFRRSASLTLGRGKKGFFPRSVVS
ncbi:ZYBA0S05-05864g1_1 [Zygosaccharomyces bailii CLIB 213]|uniref:ZYBA0S05-05864g1_1 n=1 Tax=Zygosaccharomyces bailii (strain CLIB 213 / ATCC 58445 / CBS 680 / BCRC 21525 / NBRC 1098 / NCYC 1416 / NRRL Y-2227) TaxID=1333698 RepID=A0A8J2T6V0_ZYGB2|nr:ZYBA0S05-05864g1_1 [Zygosaccharomyces bailii CLIB 213]